MPPALPPFARDRGWIWRTSRSTRLDRRVYFDPTTGHEYERDRPKGTWHEIDPRRNAYRDVDAVTGEPLGGYHGSWRSLR